MTNHFDKFDENNTAELIDTEVQADCQSTEHSSDCCSPMQRDRFELLSAYLDGEITASERRQVEAWLAVDPNTQRLYSRLLSLRQGLQTLPVAKSGQSVEQLVDRVAARLDRQPRRLIWGGLAIAAVFVGALFTSVSQDSYTPSIAENPSSQTVPNDGLMIALNRPPIEIPKAATSMPIDVLQKSN